jgi:hypothetical protein
MKIVLHGCLALLMTAGVVRADEIFLTRSETDKSPQEMAISRDAQILRIADGQLVFRVNGNEANRPVERIAYVAVANDPTLTSAEKAYVTKDWEQATDDYLRVVRAATDWRVLWAAPRLIESSNAVKRFDAGVAGFVALARQSPAAARENKPRLPDAGSKFLDDGVKDLDAAVRSAANDAHRQVLLSLLVDIHNARGDANAVAATVEQLLKLAGTSADADPASRTMIAGIRLSQARQALANQNYVAVVELIEKNEPMFVDPLQQADALFLTARARLATATDPEQLQDAALAFMRIPAHFGAIDEKPFVAESLLATAGIQEKLGDLRSAIALLEQVTVEFPGTPSASNADTELRRLRQQ